MTEPKVPERLIQLFKESMLIFPEVEALNRINEITCNSRNIRREHLEKMEDALIEAAKLSLAENGPVEVPAFFLFGRKVTIELENSP